jgi:hypothetical protein
LKNSIFANSLNKFNKMAHLTEQELATVRSLVQEFNSLKIQLADTVIHQRVITKKIEEVKQSYIQMEQSLIDVYGKDSSINIDTGEITLKSEEAAAPTMEVVK